MIIKSKITGRDVSTYYLGLASGLITRDEFELLTLTIHERQVHDVWTFSLPY